MIGSIFHLSFYVAELGSHGQLVKGEHTYVYHDLHDLFSDLYRVIECLSEFLTDGDKVYARISFCSLLDVSVSIDISKIVLDYGKIKCNISKKGDVDFNGNVFFSIKPSKE